MTDISMYRGDTLELVLCAPNMIDLTGYSISFTVKKNYRSTSPVFSCSTNQNGITIDDQQMTPGQYRVLIVPSKTEALPAVTNYLVYDIQLTDALGKVSTIRSGAFIVLPGVT